MIPFLLFVFLGIFILIMFEYRARRGQIQDDSPSTTTECCGQHLVCERELKKKLGTAIIYFDDEELDVLQGIPAENYSDLQNQTFAEIFHTLKNSEIQPWLHSLQLRNIELPPFLREEVLLILSEDAK